MSEGGDAASPARVLAPAPPAKDSALRRMARLEGAQPAEADLILLGDSLAAGWPEEVLAQAVPGLRVLNLGLPGDRVQNTLWRLDRLAPSRLRPRGLLVLVGINNLGDGDPPEAIAAGLASLVAAARQLWGEPDTVVVTVPRRGPRPGAHEAERLRLNGLLAQDLARSGSIRLLDADLALGGERAEDASREDDRLHLSRHGYELLSAALGRIGGFAGNRAPAPPR